MIVTAGVPKDYGEGSLGVALLGDVEVEVEGVVGAGNIEDVVVVGVANVAAAAAADVDGADVATAGVDAEAAAGVVDVDSAVAAVVDAAGAGAAGAGAAGADAGAAGVAGAADVDASSLLAWGFLKNGRIVSVSKVRTQKVCVPRVIHDLVCKRGKRKKKDSGMKAMPIQEWGSDCSNQPRYMRGELCPEGIL